MRYRIKRVANSLYGVLAGMSALVVMVGGCSFPSQPLESSALPECEERVVCAATDGMPGGKGGLVSLIVGKAKDEQTVKKKVAVVDVAGGDGGEAGRAVVGPKANNGEVGARGQILITRQDLVALDTSGWTERVYTPESEQFVANGTGVLGTFWASRFVVKRGTILEVSCDLRIVADEFSVEKGATLRIRQRSGPACQAFFGGHSPLTRVGGLSGGALVVRANHISIEGVVDVSGNDSETSVGGRGGIVSLNGGTFVLGDTAEVLAHGGDGADGLDETSCGE